MPTPSGTRNWGCLEGGSWRGFGVCLEGCVFGPVLSVILVLICGLCEFVSRVEFCRETINTQV